MWILTMPTPISYWRPIVEAIEKYKRHSKVNSFIWTVIRISLNVATQERVVKDIYNLNSTKGW